MTERATLSSSPLQIANLNTFNPKTSLHFADTYIFREKNVRKAYGELFVIIQIDNATRTSPQVADAVATILQNEYYRGNPAESAKNFEDALHKTNEILSDLASRGEIHWIGKLHAIVGVVKDREIHVSATGRAKAYLIRKNELAEISAGLYDVTRAASPLKTFEHQASGDLLDGDVLFFTTPGIPEQVTLQSLRQILQKNLPREATEELLNQVGRDSATANSAIVLRYDSKAQATVPVDPTEQLSPSPSSMPVKEVSAAKATSDLSTNEPEAAASSQINPLDPLTPTDATATGVNELTNKTGQKKNIFSKLKDRTAGLKKLSFRKKKKTPVAMTNDTATAQVKAAPSKYAVKSTNKATSSSTKIARGLGTAFKRIPLKVKVIGSLAVLVIFIFVVSLFVFGNTKQIQADRNVIVASFTEAKNLEEQAQASIIFKDYANALTMLEQAETKLNEIGEDKPLSEDINTLRGAIAADYEKINGAVNIEEPGVLATFVDATPVGMTLANGTLFLWSSKGKVATVTLEGGDISQAAEISSDLGKPFIGTTDQQGDLVILTSRGVLVNLVDGKVNELDVSGTFKPENPVAMKTYTNRMYMLDTGADAIFRHQQTLAGYTQGENWILDDTKVSNAVDFAIDGDIWVLLEDGTIVHLSQGTKEDFSIGGLLDPLENPTKIVTDENMSFIYVLEPTKNRLLQFDKENGDFIKQYKSEKFDDLKDVSIIEEGRTGFLLNDNTVFQIELES